MLALAAPLRAWPTSSRHLVISSSCHLVTMALTVQQLNAIVAHALPDEVLREERQRDETCYELRLGSGERVQVLAFTTVEEASTAAAALRLLAGEFDLPIPQLRATDELGATVGTPYLLVSGAEGEPLPGVQARISGDEQYAIGQRLGELASRVHRIAAPQFGPLNGAGETNERAYMLARLERAIASVAQHGLLNNAAAGKLRDFFTQFQPVERPAALVHGGLAPAHLLVRRVGEEWKLAALLGWQHAIGWAPAWEHAVWWENSDPTRDFALRVGYGNSYDQRTQRAYEQVREVALRPYRAVVLLERIDASHRAGDSDGAQRMRSGLFHLIDLLTS